MNSLLNKRIPTLFGLFLLVVTVLATSYLTNTGVILFGGAAPSENPQNIRITNVSDTSFTVTYVTDAKVIGTISLVSNGAPSQIVLDERDQISGTPKPYTVHSIAVKNIKPSTEYTFSITSGTTTYQNNGNLFSVKTGPRLVSTPSNTVPLTGQLTNNGAPAQETLVYVTTSSGQSLSALTNTNGTYVIPLNVMRKSDFASQISLTDSSVMQILATDGTLTSNAQILLKDANPVPIITLGSNYNFIMSTTPIATTEASLGFPVFPQDTTLSATPVILVPKKDQEFTDSQPQFKGTALPNQNVNIEIHSNSIITGTTTSDANGNWTFRPTTPIPPGQHILSMTTKSPSGILTTIQQSFTVYASGSQVSQSATPSGQLSPTSTPAPTIVPTAISSPTQTPTPTIPAVLSTTPKPTLPPTGSNALMSTSVLGLVTTLIGVVLFVFTKGAAL